MRGAAAVIGLLALLLAPLSVAWAGPFSNWTAVVVAGDYHAHSGGPTEAFDNARRDVSKALVELGFDKTSIQQFSVRPKRYPADAPGTADAGSIAGVVLIQYAGPYLTRALIREHLTNQSPLLEVVLASRAVRRLTHLLHCREEQANQDCDDGNHHEQFNECERTPTYHQGPLKTIHAYRSFLPYFLEPFESRGFWRKFATLNGFFRR